MRTQRPVLAGLTIGLVILGLSATSALGAPPEQPVTNPATVVTATTAILRGELNPGKAGEPGKWLFQYGPGALTECEAGAKFAPEPFGEALGVQREKVQTEVTELEPSEIYSFCVAAKNEEGLVRGPLMSFKTLAGPVKPVVVAGSTGKSNVTPFAATLAATIKPDKSKTTYTFKYATDEALAENVKTIGPAELESETGENPVSVPTGSVLEPTKTYFFRVIATNVAGSSEGPVQQFTTLAAEPPVLLSTSVSAVNSSEPQIEAKINPNYQETSYRFEYSPEGSTTANKLEGTIKTLPGAAPLPAIFEELGVLVGPTGLHGLRPGPYFYRAVASNGTGTTTGPVQEFNALASPAATTGVAEIPTRTAVTVSGAVTPQGIPTTYHFAYVPQAAYEAAVAEHASNWYAAGRNTPDRRLTRLDEEGHELDIADDVSHPVQVTLEELAPGTTYHYAIVATNELGRVTGADQTFTTSPATPPVATTGAPEAISQLSAKITGMVDTRGLQTKAYFEFGTTAGGGELLPAEIAASSGTLDSLAVSFNGSLQPATVYYYRVIASSADGTSYGGPQSFTTSGFPAAFSSGAAPTVIPYSTIAELNAKEAKEAPTPPRPLTRAEKLAKALRACQHKSKRQRAGCRRRAKRR